MKSKWIKWVLSLYLVFFVGSGFALASPLSQAAVDSMSSVAGDRDAGSMPDKIWMPLVFSNPSKSTSSSKLSPNSEAVQAPLASSIMGINTKSTMMKISELPRPNLGWGRPLPIIWPDIEPNPGDRNWGAITPSVEQDIRFAAEHGITLSVIVAGTPAWAQKVPGYACGAIKRQALPAFASFMHDLVARMSAPPYNIKYWELYNEPDVDPSISFGEIGNSCWGDFNDPYYGGGYYAEMLKAVYPAVKSADPQAQVLVGGLMLGCSPKVPGSCGPGDNSYRFFEGILRNSGANYFDGVSIHGYDFYIGKLGGYVDSKWGAAWNTTGPGITMKAEYIRELMSQYGVPDKPLYQTEGGLEAALKECDSDCQATRAYYIPQMFSYAYAQGFRSSIYYCASCGWRFVDLFTLDKSPLPGYTAYSVAWDELQGVVFRRQLQSDPGLKIFEFARGDHLLWTIWATDGATHTISLPGKPISLIDALGNSQSVSGGSFTVTVKPLYFEWTP